MGHGRTRPDAGVRATAGPVRRPSAGQRRPATPALAGLLELQRAVGNRAVLQLVARRNASPAAPLPVQRDLTVHVRQDANKPDVVANLILGTDRPKGLFAQEKRHTTAWKVSVDMVRSAVVGQKIDVAIANVAKLIKATRALPGAALAAGQAPTAKALYDAAVTEADTVLALPDKDLVTLRRAVRALLELRNVTPLSAVDTGPYSPGSGESTVAAALRAADKRPKSASQQAVRANIWSMFDFKALTHMLTEGVSGAALGRAADPKKTQRIRLAAATVLQHLASIQMAYPQAYAKAYPKGGDALLDFATWAKLKKVPSLADVSKQLAQEKVPALVTLKKRTPDPSVENPSLGLEVRLDAGGLVTDVQTSGRPPTVLGTEQGSHLVAYVLHVEVLRSLVRGRTPADAITAVVDDFDRLKADTENRMSPKEPHEVLPPKSLAAYDTAVAEFRTARKRTRKPELDPLSELEGVCLAWLGYRNAMPLASVKEGLALGAGEGTYLGQLRTLEQAADAPTPTRPNWDLAWRLLDTKALESVIGFDRRRLDVSDPSGLIHDYPGVTADVATDAAAVIGAYLDELEAVFPKVTAGLELRGAPALAHLLRVKIPLHPDVSVPIGEQLGVAEADMAAEVDKLSTPTTPPPESKKRKRGYDEEEYYDVEEADDEDVVKKPARKKRKPNPPATGRRIVKGKRRVGARK